MATVVYFNQWFSSIANVIDDIKEKYGAKFCIIGSSKNSDHSYKNSVNLFLEEDWEWEEDYEDSMRNYVDWVLNTCKKYFVDIFFVKKHAKWIMQRAEEFRALGVSLISEEYETLIGMDSKAAVYDVLSTDNKIKAFIPFYKKFENSADAIKFIMDNSGEHKYCFKLDSDEGGASFRDIDDTPHTFESLYHYRLNKITSMDALNIVADAEESGEGVNKLLFMELLDSPEISIDCYKSKKGFISIGRLKVGGRKQKLVYDEELSKICERIGDKLGLTHPYNVQFRYVKDSDKDIIENLRLLEINPRMSGGLYLEVFNGMNIAEVCLLDAVGDTSYNIENFKPSEPIYVTHVEKPIKLDTREE